MNDNQPPLVLDQKRLNEYVNQFKAPLQTILVNLNQTGPNLIDQLIQQCVTLEMTNKTLQEQNDKLVAEKTLAKTIVKDKPEPMLEANAPEPKK